jgi:CHAT domain
MAQLLGVRRLHAAVVMLAKHTILFLAANPKGSNPLALDREARDIHVELERSGCRDQFEFVTRWAVEPMDLLRELRKLRPTVVHFSGHGQIGPAAAPSDGNRRRDIKGGVGPAHSGSGGLYFQAADGDAQLVSSAAIEQTFGAAGASVRVVVLNACYTATQADALLAHVDCVVGMSGAIGDDAARHFAVGFYGGLGEREAVDRAYQQGKAAIGLEGLRDGELPQLRVRGGVDASRLVLAR